MCASESFDRLPNSFSHFNIHIVSSVVIWARRATDWTCSRRKLLFRNCISWIKFKYNCTICLLRLNWFCWSRSFAVCHKVQLREFKCARLNKQRKSINKEKSIVAKCKFFSCLQTHFTLFMCFHVQQLYLKLSRAQ